ncbi:MAG: hydroxymethylglutaryl-CoA reductase, degradative [Schleiferiaceae bacterium]|jgi:hydroxymethylglutaryl-CoA reductase|nr:hydroxymethylglutaryl-CoA reductase, degradative [Schleiferiaceae bacterium]
MNKSIKGFSKLSKEGKIEWLVTEHFENPNEAREVIETYWHADKKRQKIHDDFIENTITNFYLPLGVAPNFMINGDVISMPMAIEESSVVAAASKAAQFWLHRGGFKAEVISTKKIGHVHFMYEGNAPKLRKFIEANKKQFLEDTRSITANMRARGGGIVDFALVDKTLELDNYYQIEVGFETCDSMGANFINSCLEQFAKTLKNLVEGSEEFTSEEKDLQIVMCILSNYTPECIVRAEVSCPIDQLDEGTGISPAEFVSKFKRAVQIAEVEPYRATTHNKGIMNGIDAVVIATGNDFRAVEASCHTYASRSGKYSSLTHCEVENDIFKFWIEIPLSLGVVGGITSLHPVVKLSLEMLDHPTAEQLMKAVAVSGLAQNFAALRALVTTGIQKGHMKMHLLNILNQLEATKEEIEIVKNFFQDKVPHHSDVVQKFCELRGIKSPSEIVKKK